ncbi:MAG: hypothetical protein JSU00_07645 [Acidobacteria bacterium]|nr:hypothetical protein [Acidobacteriota bacterium]
MQDATLSVSIPCTATINLGLVGESDFAGAPCILAVDPCVAKPGAVITAIGHALGRDAVAGVFLSDPRFDWKAEIETQSQNVIRFRIPEFARKGPQRILLLTAGRRRVLIHQNVTIVVE